MKFLKSENIIIFLLATIISICAAAYLNFGLKFIFGDALVRSFHAFQVFYGYEPKLSAIGFVWPPLQTVLQLPLVLIKPLNTFGFSGNILSSIFFGINLIYLNKIGIFFNVKKGLRLLGILLFAANPMVFFYAINGMSEIIGVTFMIMTLYYFLKYINDKNIFYLILSGLSVTLAVMTRWEMASLLVVILPLTIFLPLIGKTNSKDEFQSSPLIFVLPVIAALCAWAFISWMITGSLFPGAVQIDNNLGDGTAQIAAGESTGSLILKTIDKLFLLSPFVALVAILSTIKMKRNDLINVLTILGFGLILCASQGLLFVLGKTVGELRYFMSIIPITYILLFFAMRNSQKKINSMQKIKYSLLFLFMVLSSTTAFRAMASNQYNNQEHLFIKALKNGHNNTGYYNYEEEEKIAEYINQNAHKRSVLADDSVAFSIIYLSQKPEIFIQTIDSNFKVALNNPINHNIEYILVSRPNTDGVEDLINKTYPAIFEKGIDSFVLEKDFGTWRLYSKIGLNKTITTKRVTQECKYTTVIGDSLWGIADEKLGDGYRYTEIVKMNNKIASPSNINPTQVITIPCS